ncbi:MAG: hypothetical protein HW421_1288 [Ignavibacteria bacterium]|nr:hypothetical protein [Ignavibacteria bacterium]
MKIYIIAILVTLLIVLFTGCESPMNLAPADVSTEPNNYFPLTMDNYWIYQTSLDSKTSIDSLVVTGNKIIDGKKATEITVYRNGSLYLLAYFLFDNSKILLYSKLMEPFIDTIPNNFTNSLKPAWRMLANFKNNWSVIDSTSGEVIPYLDSIGNWLNSNAKVKNELSVSGNNSNETVKSSNPHTYDNAGITTIFTYNFSIKWLYKLIAPDYVTFYKDRSLRYLNDQTIIRQELNFEVTFERNIGLTQASGTIIDEHNQPHNYIRKLLRCRIN